MRNHPIDHERKATMRALHPSLTPEILIEAAESQMSGMDNPGFCIACGAEHYECEPDARRYPCDDGCGRTVYGAEELVLMGFAG